jgi:hypothetical protein
MDSANLLGSRKISDGAGDAQDTVEAAGREPHRRGCICEELAAGLVGRCDLVEKLAVGLGVRARSMTVVAICLDLPSGCDAAGDLGAAFGRRG